MQSLKIIGFCLVIILFATNAQCGPNGFAASKAPAEYNGYKWGAALEDCKGLVPVPDARMKNTYYREDENLQFGQAELLSTAYYFRDDHLYSVGISFRGEKNNFFLKDYLIQKYGPGRQIGTRYGWMWEDFSLVLFYPPAGGENSIGTLIFRYEGKVK